MQGAELGDARLESRLVEIAEALAAKPAESLPKAMEDEAALEATYRFLGNKRVKPAEVLAPHVRQTVARCRELKRALALMDTTEVRYGGDREELGYLSNEKGRGVMAHVCLAADPEAREPQGVLHCETWARKGPKKKRKNAWGAADSEALRWERGAAAVHELLPEAICVGDREADMFHLVTAMRARRQDFIIRAGQNRLTTEGPLWDALDEAELVTTRELALPTRPPRKRKSERKRFPPRSEHVATLELRARRVELRSPASNRNDYTRRHATTTVVNLVHVIERDPPGGDEPVEWILLTSLPIKTKKDVDFIVDAYRARWVIEEFFKALKSGCALEKRQLESVPSVANLIAVSLPIAWLLLRLRHLSRDAPDRPAGAVLSPLMLKCLRILLVERKRKPLPARPTCRELTWGIAGLGGHITNNGEPGLIVLGRGLADLLAATAVAAALSANVSETATPVQFTEQGDRVTCHASLVNQRSFSS